MKHRAVQDLSESYAQLVTEFVTAIHSALKKKKKSNKDVSKSLEKQ